MGVLLAVLFGGLALGRLAPTSWLGAQVKTLFGGIGYAFSVCVVFAGIEWGLSKLGIPLLVRQPSPNRDGALNSEESQLADP